MRVIHVSPTQFGSGGLLGGGERYPLELARALAPHIDCELITFGPRPARYRERSGLKIRVLRPLAHMGGHPAHPLALTLPAALLRSRPDIIHTHHMRSLPSRMAAITARLSGAATAVTDHGLQGGDWAGLLPSLFDRFLLVSRYSARELGAPPGRTRVIYGGADPARYFPDPQCRREGVLFVGRITPHKGVDRLIQALPAGATLRIAGSVGHDPHPPESGYPDLLRRMAAGRRIDFLGPVSDVQLPALYRSTAVFCLPSVNRTLYGRPVRVSELLGLSLLEAMASGTPVVASSTGGVPEVVEHGVTGFLVEPGNIEELRERLTELLRDTTLAAKMGKAARECVLEQFTWEECAGRCLRAYAEML